MAKKQFKAESKRLLELMINSIYTNKEIFLRELISNASDALDKRYYLSLTDESAKVERKDLTIRIERHPDTRTLVIEDTGIGMTAEELEKNLGTIARSGSADFKKTLEENTENVDIIGQFGVGFYSAFMVAKTITVDSRNVYETTGSRWISSGEDGYTITPIEKESVGTRITLELKEDTGQDQFSDYLNEFTIRNLIRKYSDYIRYPIHMDVIKTEKDPDDNEKTITRTEQETLNSMVPLWKKRRKDITEEQYADFYKSSFNDWQQPLKTIHYSVEGNLSYTALLFIPKTAPFNFYNADFSSGLKLYSKGVFILDQAKELLPDAYRFVTGLVDSDDISLNISREILQQDHQVKDLSASLEKKIHSALEDLMKNDRTVYEAFFEQFGLNLKHSIYKSFGAEQDKLKDLLLYRSGTDHTYVSLAEYRKQMPEDQKEIYFSSGKTPEEIDRNPLLEKVREKGYDILYFTDPIDEFVVAMMPEYDGYPFKSIANADVDFASEEEKEARKAQLEENKDLLSSMKEALNGSVKDVRLSSRLKHHAVCLVSESGLSIEMEKVLSQDPNNRGLKAEKILEINPDHPVFKALQSIAESDPEQLKTYSGVLYDLARIMDGLSIEDPIGYADRIAELMVKAIGH